MQLQTPVDVPSPSWRIQPADRLACIGSCFADNMGQRIKDDHFRAVVNPYGVMYNPISILHTVEGKPYPHPEKEVHPLHCEVAIITLGTNHVYEEKTTGKIVDNCQKRPQREFTERRLSVDDCTDALERIVHALQQQKNDVKVVFTVSPIRYRKYGYHESQLSKSTLLLAIDRLLSNEKSDRLHYFPAYEIVNDELRDYRFYKPDMLHPSEQTVDYLYERFKESCFSAEAIRMAEEWKSIREALNHRPLHPDSDTYLRFRQDTLKKKEEFERKYFPLPAPYNE